MSSGQFISHCTADALAQAALHLKRGGLVAFPTETVYGLGADATNQMAVSRIYAVKGRPHNHPVIVHIPSMRFMEDWSHQISDYAIALARNFWPGPMTLIVQRSALAKDFITGGQETVGVRVPDNSLALALLNEFAKIGGKGVAAPSANRFGHVSPTTAQAVAEELTKFLSPEDLILDGGSCQVGVESTIIDCTGAHPRILRPGAITAEMIEEVTGLDVRNEGSEIRVSGSLDSHYSPKAKVLLDENPESGDGFIAMSEVSTPDGVIRLASPHSLEEFARVLFESLREADRRNIKKVVVSQPKGDGLAIAIRDRLRRAAD